MACLCRLGEHGIGVQHCSALWGTELVLADSSQPAGRRVLLAARHTPGTLQGQSHLLQSASLAPTKKRIHPVVRTLAPMHLTAAARLFSFLLPSGLNADSASLVAGLKQDALLRLRLTLYIAFIS